MSNIYEQLVARVNSVDYIIGPKMKLELKDIETAHSRKRGSNLDKICQTLEDEFLKTDRKHRYYHPEEKLDVVNNSELTCREYNTLLLADLVLSLERQASLNFGKHTPDPLAVYFKNEGATDFIQTDSSNRKYIRLTEEGVKLFKEIWNDGKNYGRNIMSLSKLQKKGFGISPKIEAIANGEYLSSDQAMIVNQNNTSPSLLVQNESESVGFTPEYVAPDKSIVGSRGSVKGRYLS